MRASGAFASFFFFIAPVMLPTSLTVVAFVGFWFVTQPALIVVFARCYSIFVDVTVAPASDLKLDTASNVLSRCVGFGVEQRGSFERLVLRKNGVLAMLRKIKTLRPHYDCFILHSIC